MLTIWDAPRFQLHQKPQIAVIIKNDFAHLKLVR